MYKCEVCGRQVGPGVTCERVVVEVRMKNYYEKDAEGHEHMTGRGHETVREVNACLECVAKAKR